MTNASALLSVARKRVKQASDTLLRSHQFALGPVELNLQLLKFPLDMVRDRPLGRIANVRTAIRADVDDSRRLEQTERSADGVASYAVSFFELAVRRELAAGRVLPGVDVRTDQARYVLAVGALLVWRGHGAIVPRWLTPKPLTSCLVPMYCRKPMYWHTTVDSSDLLDIFRERTG